MDALALQAALLFAALGHPSFHIREFVAANIPPHLAALGQRHPDPEIAARCHRIIEQEYAAAFVSITPAEWPRIDAAWYVYDEPLLRDCCPQDWIGGVAVLEDTYDADVVGRQATSAFCADLLRRGVSQAEVRRIIGVLAKISEEYGDFGPD